MGIRTSVSLDVGIECPEAYTRITSVSFTKNELVVNTSTFAHHQARLDGKPDIMNGSYMLPWQEEISFPELYTQLKLLVPDFCNAADV